MKSPCAGGKQLSVKRGAKLYRFGFLDLKTPIVTDTVAIEPLPNFDEVRADVVALQNRDGFVYPPTVSEWTAPAGRPQESRLVPSTTRPTLLYRLPASHTIRVASRGVKDGRYADAGFVLNLLAYLYGVRLQFEGWSVDGRVPVRLRCTNNVIVAPNTAEDFVGNALRMWRFLPREKQRLVSGLLFGHSRATMSEWDWEQFAAEYTVFDALWLFAAVWSGRRPGHGQRIAMLCRQLGVRHPTARVRRIVDLRNDLIHEGMWMRQPAGTGRTLRGLQHVRALWQLNQRLIATALRYPNKYTRTTWWGMTPRSFDLIP